MDPSGYGFFSDLLGVLFAPITVKELRPIIAIVAIVYAPEISAAIGWTSGVSATGAAIIADGSGAAALGITSGAVASGMLGGAIAGAAMGGNLQSAVTGGISGGLFGGLHGWDVANAGFWESAAKVGAHGMAGGVMSEMQGGNFQSGLLAAAFTQTASQLGAFNNLGDPNTASGKFQNAMAAAALGGTASVIGGGKFANGALTGAFSRLFNDIAIDFYDDKKGNPFGHIGGHVVGEPSMGLYPKSDFDALSGNKTSGDVLYDQLEGGHTAPSRTVILKTTLEQDQKFRNYLQSNRGYSKLMYDLNANSARNCTTFIETGLHAAGIYAPAYVRPRDLIDDLATRNK